MVGMDHMKTFGREKNSDGSSELVFGREVWIGGREERGEFSKLEEM